MTITGRLINNKIIVCWGPVWSCIRNIKYILVAGHLNVTVMLCGWVHLVVLYKASLMCIVMSDRAVPYTQVQHTCRDLASHREVERWDKGLPRIPHGPGNEARLNPFFKLSSGATAPLCGRCTSNPFDCAPSRLFHTFPAHTDCSVCIKRQESVKCKSRCLILSGLWSVREFARFS